MRRIFQLWLLGAALFTATVVNAAARNVIVILINGAGPVQLELARRVGAERAGFSNVDALPFVGTLLPLPGQFEFPDIAALNALAVGKAFDNGFGMHADGEQLESLLVGARFRGRRTGFLTDGPLNAAAGGAFFAHEMMLPDPGKLAAWIPLADLDVLGGGLKESLSDDATMRQLGYVVHRGAAETPGAIAGKRLLALQSDDETASCSVDLPEGAVTLPARLSQSLRWLAGPRGFLLVVECSRIGRAAAANDTAAMLTELWEFDRVLGRALDFFKHNPADTLILVASLYDTGELLVVSDEPPFESVGMTRPALLKRLAGGDVSFAAALKLAGAEDLFAPGSEQLRQIETVYAAACSSREERDYAIWLELVLGQRDRHAGVIWGGNKPSISLSTVMAIGRGARAYQGEYDAVALHAKLCDSLGVIQRPE